MTDQNLYGLMQRATHLIKSRIEQLANELDGGFDRLIPYVVWSLVFLGCLLLGVLWTAGTLMLLIVVDLLLLDRYFSRRLFKFGSQAK